MLSREEVDELWQPRLDLAALQSELSDLRALAGDVAEMRGVVYQLYPRDTCVEGEKLVDIVDRAQRWKR